MASSAVSQGTTLKPSPCRFAATFGGGRLVDVIYKRTSSDANDASFRGSGIRTAPRANHRMTCAPLGPAAAPPPRRSAQCAVAVMGIVISTAAPDIIGDIASRQRRHRLQASAVFEGALTYLKPTPPPSEVGIQFRSPPCFRVAGNAGVCQKAPIGLKSASYSAEANQHGS